MIIMSFMIPELIAEYFLKTILNDILISNQTATINGIGGTLTTNIIGTISYDNDKDEYVMSFDDDDTYTPFTFRRVGGL